MATSIAIGEVIIGLQLLVTRLRDPFKDFRVL